MSALRALSTAFLFAALSTNGKAQENLILNPGFEGKTSSTYHSKDFEVTTNPYYPNEHLVIDNDTVNGFGLCDAGDPLFAHWTQPTRGTADCWNSPHCKYRDPIPLAHTGNGRLGLVLYTKYSEYCEYAQTRITQPLIKGKTYYLEFYLLREVNSGWKTGSVGILFSDTSINDSTISRLMLTPQIEFCNRSDLFEAKQWRKMSTWYTAKGGEEYLIIGSFGVCSVENADQSWDNTKDNHIYTQENSAYYYFDDWLLTGDTVLTAPHYENIVLVADVSSSMYRGGHINTLKDSLKHYLSGAGKYAKVTLITFGSEFKTLLNVEYIKDTTQINAVLHSIAEGKGTRVDPALAEAYRKVDSVFCKTASNRIFLFSDGNFELERKSKQLIKERLVSKNISLTFIQYGNTPNEVMAKLTKKDDMQYYLAKETAILNLLDAPPSPVKKECECGVTTMRKPPRKPKTPAQRQAWMNQYFWK